jgi:sporulation protein YlmC with PRC-barrel domain
MKCAFATVSVLALLIAVPAAAQAPTGTADVNTGATAPPATVVGRDRALAAGSPVAPAAAIFPTAAEAEKFIGTDVHGMGGDEIGRIENLLIDPDGRVRAAIIGFGRLLGADGNIIALAWDHLKVTGDRIMINMPEDQIKAEPRWSRDRPGAFAELRPHRQ